MTREKVRNLKRAVRASAHGHASAQDKLMARESALLLLARSIDFGHGRLAVVRLAVAVSSGAEVPGEHWRYCARVAESSHDRRLQALYLAAAHEAGGTARAGYRETTCTSSLR